MAWHLGNRHVDVQVMDGKLRIRRDHVLEDMLRGSARGSTRSKRPLIRRPAPMAIMQLGHHHG